MDEINLPIKHESKPYLMIPLPDGATNGDVIKALFPNYRTDEMSHSVWVGYDDMSFRREWWNAPYKADGSKTEQGLAYADQETMMPAT